MVPKTTTALATSLSSSSDGIAALHSVDQVAPESLHRLRIKIGNIVRRVETGKRINGQFGLYECLVHGVHLGFRRRNPF